MKTFSIKYDREQDRILLSCAIPTETGDFVKKTFLAQNGDELWKGIKTLAEIEILPPKQKAEAFFRISQCGEREALEQAITTWLAKGNKIKICPPFGQKLLLTQEEQNAILAIAAELDIGEVA